MFDAVVFPSLVLAATLAASCAQPQTIEAGQLERFRLSVESYMSRIQTIQMDYVSDWVGDPDSVAWQSLKALTIAKLKARLRETTNAAEREKISRRIESYDPPRSSSSSYKLSYAFPSMRFDRTDSISTERDWQKLTRRIRAIDHRSFVGIDLESKFALKVSQVSDKELEMFSRLPTSSLGLKSYHAGGPDDQCLESLLSVPKVTLLEGNQKLMGLDAIVVRVGPGIPIDVRPNGLGDSGYVKLWLAPSHGYLAIRKEFHVIQSVNSESKASEDIFSVELADFRPVRDSSRPNSTVDFPFSISFRDGAGTTISKISSVVINSALPPNEFRPSIPEGFSVSADGGMVTKLVGGIKAKDHAVKAAAKTARVLLETSCAASKRHVLTLS